MQAHVSLRPELALNRMVLVRFGFEATPPSLAAYRSIFAHYASPTHYDRDVMQALHYFRANRCVYYTAPELVIGQAVPDCRLLPLDGDEQQQHAVSLHGVAGQDAPLHALVCAFSAS